jgi:hypothetical protein
MLLDFVPHLISSIGYQLEFNRILVYNVPTLSVAVGDE